MTEVQVGTFGRAVSIAVEAVGRRLIEAGLGGDGSLLTPGEPIWTLANLEKLKTEYVDKPDMGSEGFFEKLKRQLAGASPAVIQLYAELLILNVLPIINVGGELKVKQVEIVLNLSTDPVTLPDDVRAALLGGGVFHGGQAFTTYRWAQIAYLIQFAIHFKGLSEQRRLDALAEPLIFREEVNAVPTGQAAQRQALLYLAFPHFYLPVVKLEHRTAIRDGLADRYLLESPGDVDVDLSRIYAALTEAEGKHIDLYVEPWVDLWQSDLNQHPDVPTALPGPVTVHLPDVTQELASRIHVSRSWLQDCVELLRDRRQLIFYGPPGTGKTYIAQELSRHIADKENVKLVQFHPAYSYEDFFEGFRPQGESGGQMQGFSLKAGPLRRMVDMAAENPGAAYVLIIDEINRGNLPKIFGELYFLLEYRDQAIDLMYSSDSAEPFSLPKNIYVIGTMNTADRSIALVDAALRRRFAFLPLHPSEEPTSGILRRWLTSKDYDTWLADLHDELNSRITDNDFKIGPSYFMREKIATDRTDKSLELMWRTDILPLLEEHHFGDLNVDIAARYGLPALRKSLAAKAGILDEDIDSLETEPDDDDDAATDPD
jgi:MoxR-like ATPase